MASPAPSTSTGAGGAADDGVVAAATAGTETLGVLRDLRARLGCDTVAVLLADHEQADLEPLASVGFGRTARSAVRVPFGEGFAGRIALTREPLAVEQVDPAAIVNPVLAERGVASLLGVPLLHDGSLVGVLHVGSMVPRTFDGDELRVVLEHGSRLAGLLRGRRAMVQHSAALALQRSLLPARPKPIEGLEIDVRYIPAEGELGGDWYDVFQLQEGRVGIVMGDVVGHGLPAAIIMGRLRSALRAYALDHEDPAVVLDRLDRKLSYFEEDAMATVLYAVTSPPFEEFRFATAGHWPPMLLAPDAPGRPVELSPTPFLGAGVAHERTSQTVTVPEGGTLVLFTDGLLERRPTAGKPAPDPWLRLVDIAARLPAGEHADETCRRIVREFVGEDAGDDDIALLAVRRTGADPDNHPWG